MQVWRTINGNPVLITVPYEHGSSASGTRGTTTPTSTSYQFCNDDEVVCWKTRCQYCKYSPIWFIRHNGGSVFVEELGGDWTKHGCYYRNSGPQAVAESQMVLSSLHAVSKLGPESAIAVVTKVVVTGHFLGGFSMLAVEFLNGRRACVSVGGNQTQLLGQFVVAELRRATGKLRLEGGNTLGVFDTKTSPGRLGLTKPWLRGKPR